MKILCIIVATITVLGVALAYAFPLARVDGRSMYPTYKDGGILLTTRLFNHRELKKGQVYVYSRLDDEGNEVLVVKRLTMIVDIPGLECFFEGDNQAESYDSRHYGFVDKETIVAKVLWQIKK